MLDFLRRRVRELGNVMGKSDPKSLRCGCAASCDVYGKTQRLGIIPLVGPGVHCSACDSHPASLLRGGREIKSPLKTDTDVLDSSLVFISPK